MSGGSKDADLKSTETNNTPLNETKKKVKRNYCDVCQVQCSGNKNFEDHNKGRKHHKKLSISIEAEQKKKRNAFKKGKNVPAIKIDAEKSNLVPSKSKVSGASDSLNKISLNSETLETMDSHSSHSNFRSNKPIKSRNPPVNKNLDFPNYHNRNKDNYSDIPSYYNSHYYKNQQPYYNSYNYPSYTRWNSSYPRPALLESRDYVNTGLIPPNFYDFGQNNSNYNSGHSLFSLQNPENFVKNRNPLILQTSSNVDDTNERGHCESNVSQEDSLNSRDSINNSHISSINERENTSCSKDSNQPSTSNDAHMKNSKSLQGNPTPLSRISEKKRIRSRSLSSTESNFSVGRRKTDRNENQSADSDEADQQKIKDWTNTLLETSHGQISRLIHPSNYKDKAAVNHLITNLSKSKRKENLSRLKFRSDSICSNETNDDEKEIGEVYIETEQSVEVTSTQDNSEVVEDTEDTPPVKKSKRNSNSKSSKLNEELDSEVDSAIDKISKKSPNLRETEKETYIFSSSKKSTKKNEKKDVSTDKLKRTKRKSLNISSDNIGKKRRSSDISIEKVSTSKATEQSIPDSSATNSTSAAADIEEMLNMCFSNDTVLKEEVAESLDENPSQSSPVPNSIINPSQNLDLNSGFSVETLINLFATGDVKVKREFNDPIIEAIKAVDSSILLNAFSNKIPTQNKNSVENQVPINSTPKAVSAEPCPSNDFDKHERNCISPVILGANMTSTSNSPLTTAHNVLPSPNLPFVNLDNGSSSPLDKGTSGNSFSGIEDINFMPKNKSDYSPHLKKLIKDLQEVSSQEENVKQNLLEAKGKINEYQMLLEEWKNRKKKLQEEEEHLRKRRVDIIELMQEAVKSAGETSNEKEPDTTPNLPSKRQCPVSESSESSSPSPVQNSKPSIVSTNLSKPLSKKRNKSPQSSESDEISILPLLVKIEEPEIIDIDCEDIEESSQKVGGSYQNEVNTPSKNVPSVFDMKNFTAHSTVVNCLLVFEDYLYTCSNDSTAKRFNLKNPSETVAYLHPGKNVTEIVVEKVQSEALVLTSCSNRMISLFIASNGTKIKTFFQPCPIMSICKGWGKFYSGMADGSINVYNWKYEEKEIIRCEHPASRIATAHQGRLHVLIILCSNGNISVRDAETGLLIRYIKGFVKIPSWLTVFNDLAYLSSSDKTLTVLDILTGRAEKKLYVASHTTGLSVYDDFIFTISYSGVINCYNKEKVSDKKVYYGAGKNGLTCIHVYQDWVFTGNRKGDIYVFKFKPSDGFPCQCGQCCMTFGLKEDLTFHVEKDHVTKKKISKCNWGICNYKFSNNWSVEDKMRHMNRHICQGVIK